MRVHAFPRAGFAAIACSLLFALRAVALEEPGIAFEGKGFRVVAAPSAPAFSIEDARSGVAWKIGPPKARLRTPSGSTWKALDDLRPRAMRMPGGSEAIALEGRVARVLLSPARGARSVEISWMPAGEDVVEEIQLVGEVWIPSGPESFAIIPCREGLLVPSDSGPPFRRGFGTSEYEGCHMNVIGLSSGGGAALLTWDDAYVTAEVARAVEGEARGLTVAILGRRTALSVLFTPLGKGGIDEIAAGYRDIAAERGLRVTLAEKMGSRPALDRIIGASNFKLWTCLNRKMSEDSRTEESVKVNWTFEEAAQVAEHLKKDLEIDRCLYTLGGWIHRGYDCQHPDVLPAAPECGGNDALRSALERIRALGYADCLHDNYQDIYRDSPSWSEALIMKRPDGSLAAGGRWLGGRAYLVCAPMTLELAKRPQNLPEIQHLFAPLTYFIDTTYAVGPQTCFDPAHPLSRNDDIRWKIALSDYARQVFGVFGSECGREWAIPSSDFFEGLVGVGGKYYHQLDPASLGATVIPFFEMVFHDCQVAWGKYGFDPEAADEYVLHHIACARPLHHHSIPPGLYWKRPEGKPAGGGVFARADGGWAQGMCRTDRFLKNTHEVTGPLQRITANLVLEKLEFLRRDRSLRRMTWGKGEVVVTCNFGGEEAKATSAVGGDVTLPRWGFLVESPRFVAFHATRFGGVDLPGGAVFTLTSLDGDPIRESRQVRAFHASGSATIAIGGKAIEVAREEVLRF